MLRAAGVAPGTPGEVWFQDGHGVEGPHVRIGQQGTLSRIWARRETRPRAPRDQRYRWAYLFGAVCPARGTGAALVLPHANAHAMTLHLDEIGRCVAPGAHGVVLLDGAGYHVAKDLKVPANLSLLPLPPYSPELKAQENVRQYLRQNKLSLTVWDGYKGIVGHCCEVWNWLMAMPEQITSIASREWAQAVSI